MVKLVYARMGPDSRLRAVNLHRSVDLRTLADFLVGEMDANNGNVNVLEGLCRTIDEIYVGESAPKPPEPLVIDRWRDALSTFEAAALRRRLLERFPTFDMLSAVLSLRLQLEEQTVETPQGPRTKLTRAASGTKNRSVFFLLIFYRVLAMLEGLERDSVH